VRKLRREPLVDCELLHDRQIGIEARRPVEGVAMETAERAAGIRRKRRGRRPSERAGVSSIANVSGLDMPSQLPE